MTVAAAGVLAGIGLLLWGGYLAGYVTADYQTPYDLSGGVLCIIGFAVMAASGAAFTWLRQWYADLRDQATRTTRP